MMIPQHHHPLIVVLCQYCYLYPVSINYKTLNCKSQRHKMIFFFTMHQGAYRCVYVYSCKLLLLGFFVYMISKMIPSFNDQHIQGTFWEGHFSMQKYIINAFVRWLLWRAYHLDLNLQPKALLSHWSQCWY